MMVPITPSSGAGRPAESSNGSGGAPVGGGGAGLETGWSEIPVADGTVDLAEGWARSGIEEILVRLDTELVGLAPIKTRIAEIAALLLVERVRSRLGASSTPPTLHMSFTGNPGTGKTTVARRMAEVLHGLDHIRTPRLVSVTRDDLVGEYVGHTAPKTKDVLKRASGGVLFIDEAYYLHRPENERDYGPEAIEILLQYMEDRPNDPVVVMAGYRDRMDRFYSANPGLRSRVAHHLDFPDYGDDELVAIGELLLAQHGYRFGPDGAATLRRLVGERRERPHFANARSVRNVLDRARLHQARRILAAGTVAVEALDTIEPEDLA
jgi:probable Rubsico expression protein CbbX